MKEAGFRHCRSLADVMLTHCREECLPVGGTCLTLLSRYQCHMVEEQAEQLRLAGDR
ncbi:hypothetical protein GCM10008094_01210 [Aidingimonas halophila]|nr:hypothetical protein GCM10008094_01210 [Aidingimonas halophila]